MAAKTYMELVNRALLESKVTLDPLTSVNFAAPSGSILYDHFKTWVNTAYEELALARPDWHFQQERATVTVYPRVYVSLVAPVAPGDVLVGRDSNVELTVVEVFPEIPASLNSATLSVTYTDPTQAGNLIINELFDRTLPGPGTLGVAQFKDYGYYDFRELYPSAVQYIVQDSVSMSKTVADAVVDGDNASWPVMLVPWNDFHYRHPMRWVDKYFSKAQLISQKPDGDFELYPRLDKPYLLSFEYVRQHTPMVLHSDTPVVMPDQYHLYLMWKAVLEYADFDGNGKLFSRATKHINEYRYWLERDEAPRPTMIPTGFRVNY